MYKIQNYFGDGLGEQTEIFFAETHGTRSIDCAHDNISWADIWSCFMANTFLSPRFRTG